MDTPLKTRIEPYLDDIKHRRLTVKKAAETLNVSYTYLSRVLNEIDGQPGPGQKILDKQLVQARRVHRLFVATTMPLAQAAKAAKCHPRTIQRLLERHNGKS
jgi:AraC-like DNA-binding protein